MGCAADASPLEWEGLTRVPLDTNDNVSFILLGAPTFAKIDDLLGGDHLLQHKRVCPGTSCHQTGSVRCAVSGRALPSSAFGRDMLAHLMGLPAAFPCAAQWRAEIILQVSTLRTLRRPR